MFEVLTYFDCSMIHPVISCLCLVSKLCVFSKKWQKEESNVVITRIKYQDLTLNRNNLKHVLCFITLQTTSCCWLLTKPKFVINSTCRDCCLEEVFMTMKNRDKRPAPWYACFNRGNCFWQRKSVSSPQAAMSPKVLCIKGWTSCWLHEKSTRAAQMDRILCPQCRSLQWFSFWSSWEHLEFIAEQLQVLRSSFTDWAVHCIILRTLDHQGLQCVYRACVIRIVSETLQSAQFHCIHDDWHRRRNVNCPCCSETETKTQDEPKRASSEDRSSQWWGERDFLQTDEFLADLIAWTYHQRCAEVLMTG